MTHTLKALSDPARRKILELLKHQPLNAGQIHSHFHLSHATISHHLAVLKNAGLITAARTGTFITYELSTPFAEGLIEWLTEFTEIID